MGLDVTAYRQLKPCAAPTGAESGDFDYDRHLHVDDHGDFPGRAAGLQGQWFECSCADGMRLGFRAGSYSGYNRWRDWLAKLAGYPLTKHAACGYDADRSSHAAGAWAATGGPFWELINFSDCEGTIGPTVSAKLAQDFAEWDERAKAAAEAADEDRETRGWLYQQYQTWRHAFEMAADGGAVDFH